MNIKNWRKQQLITDFLIASIFVLVALFFAIGIGFASYNALHTETITNVTVESLQQQQLISGSKNNVSTEIRYLVITDKGTFVCESSLLNGKFNNSDIFWHLKEGKKYTFYVSGYGKSLLFDYQNILKVENEY